MFRVEGAGNGMSVFVTVLNRDSGATLARCLLSEELAWQKVSVSLCVSFFKNSESICVFCSFKSSREPRHMFSSAVL